MIIEGIVTTVNSDGSTNISPMGPIVDAEMNHLRLRPFNTSTTYKNLKRTGEGVFHVTDDVMLLARAAVGQIDVEPELICLDAIKSPVLADACRWYAFRVIDIDDTEERVSMNVDVVERGVLREFCGFNRAKHAVVEAAILATRVDFLPHGEILAELDRLAAPVEKTAGTQEREAFAFLNRYILAKVSADV
ncbi:MAG: DUF447 family protein [Pirellulales bacterium]|nr:DUF447 family protein [Pirellulales bacterium]